MKRMFLYIASFLVCATVSCLNLAQAQTRQVAPNSESRNAPPSAGPMFSNLIAQARPARHAVLFPLTNKDATTTNSSALKTAAARASLNASSNRAIIRLPMWTGSSATPSRSDLTFFGQNFAFEGQGKDWARSMPAGSATVATILGSMNFRSTPSLLAAAGGPPLFTVAHDPTLQGDGTSGSPLGIKLPLTLSGSLNLNGLLTIGGDIHASNIVSDTNRVNGNLTVTGNSVVDGSIFVRGILDVGDVIRANTTSGNAIEARGGDSTAAFPISGIGVRAIGGKNDTGEAGRGLDGEGGDSDSGTGGIGVAGIGGQSNSATGGVGVSGFGGFSLNGTSGAGVKALGGTTLSGTGGAGLSANGGLNLSEGDGGPGIIAVGGRGVVTGHSGGIGIIATGGAGTLGAAAGLAGRFEGDVVVTGNLSKGGGSFKIDHPLDPENKYLYHSFVESPDMKNIYDGTVTTDVNGAATVKLPDYFQALNQDFRYQLTVIGAFAQAIVANEIEDNRFVIKTSVPKVKVSWQVTGVRHDAYANKHRILVEERKPENERGSLLHPDAFNLPGDKATDSVKVASQDEKANPAGERGRQ